MFHGGTNFDCFNGDEVASSYDYGTLLGQGRRPARHLLRREAHGNFATSFPDILENSVNSDDSDFVTDNDMKLCMRKSPDGTVIFLQNGRNVPQTATLQSGETLDLDLRKVAPILVDTPNLSLNSSFPLSV